MDALGYASHPSSSTFGGDVRISTRYTYRIGAPTDLYTLLLHETGHALGLDHSAAAGAVMGGNAFTTFEDLTPDDIAGIQSVYGPRQKDLFDSRQSNDQLATASSVSLGADGSLLVDADLTTIDDVDIFQVQRPAAGAGTWTINVDPRLQSLLAAAVDVYDSTGKLLATASGRDEYGALVSLSIDTSTEMIFIAVRGATRDEFAVGTYELNVHWTLVGPGEPTATPILESGEPSADKPVSNAPPLYDNSPFPRHNALLPGDVDGDGHVLSEDIAILVGELLLGGARRLTAGGLQPNYLDVVPDNHLLPEDLAQALGELIRQAAGENTVGESEVEDVVILEFAAASKSLRPATQPSRLSFDATWRADDQRRTPEQLRRFVDEALTELYPTGL